jgi:hypothetical protein
LDADGIFRSVEIVLKLLTGALAAGLGVGRVGFHISVKIQLAGRRPTDAASKAA